jgi:hypothetical protein
MKTLKKSYLVVMLVIIFIGIAGGFTKTVNHTSKSAGCEATSMLTDDIKIPDYLLGVNLDDPQYSVCWSATGILEGEYGTRTVFDPKSTALFVIAGVIVALVGLEMRKKK